MFAAMSDDESVEMLELSVATRVLLDDLGVTTIGTLCALGEDEILEAGSRGALRELRCVLAEQGLALRGETVYAPEVPPARALGAVLIRTPELKIERRDDRLELTFAADSNGAFQIYGLPVDHAAVDASVKGTDLSLSRVDFQFAGGHGTGKANLAFAPDGHRLSFEAALKDAAETWLPNEIVHRPKASFGAPLRAWVRNDLRELVSDVLVSGELVRTGMLRRPALNRLIADDQAGRQDNAKQIWQLLSMELWYRDVRSMGVAA